MLEEIRRSAREKRLPQESVRKEREILPDTLFMLTPLLPDIRGNEASNTMTPQNIMQRCVLNQAEITLAGLVCLGWGWLTG